MRGKKTNLIKTSRIFVYVEMEVSSCEWQKRNIAI